MSHLQIEQIIRWKRQYPTWRMEPTRETLGNDVPNFCYDPTQSKAYHTALGKTELQKGWGFWDFIRIKTNKYDVKQTVSKEISEILNTYTKEEIDGNNFIYNDLEKI